MTTEQDFTSALHELFGGEDINLDIKSVRTFEDAGLLTRNSGLVVTLRDGSQFEVTIVKSR